MYLWSDASVFWQFWKYSAIAWKIRPDQPVLWMRKNSVSV